MSSLSWRGSYICEIDTIAGNSLFVHLTVGYSMIGYWRWNFFLKLPPIWIMNEELLEHEIQNHIKTILIKNFFIYISCFEFIVCYLESLLDLMIKLGGVELKKIFFFSTLSYSTLFDSWHSHIAIAVVCGPISIIANFLWSIFPAIWTPWTIFFAWFFLESRKD